MPLLTSRIGELLCQWRVDQGHWIGDRTYNAPSLLTVMVLLHAAFGLGKLLSDIPAYSR